MATTLRTLGLTALAISSLVSAQQAGTPETHPRLLTHQCTTAGGCKPLRTSVVLDVGAHAIQSEDGTSCTTSNGSLDPDLCPDAETCGANCYIQGVSDYASRGVTTRGDAMTLKMYVDGQAVSPRVYLLDPSGKKYEYLQLNGQEFTFDVDMSNLPCGMNGALYFSQMDASGGRSDINPAGATYGTGYCDAQCFNTSSWINGAANVNELGACCNEMDIWEANTVATAYTPHTCSEDGFYACSGSECDLEGVCDKWGCGFNPYALGKHNFYGPYDKVNTKKRMTVVTQFLTDDETATGELVEIRRVYKQGERVVENVSVKFQDGMINSLTDPYCDVNGPYFTKNGGLAESKSKLQDAITRVHTDVLSQWVALSAPAWSSQ